MTGQAASLFPTKRLKYVVSLRRSRVEGSKDDRPYIGLENIESWTGKLLGKSGATDEDPSALTLEGTSLTNTFEPGDVLFGKLRPYLAKAWVGEFSGRSTTEFLVMRPVDTEPRFLRYVFLWHGFVDAVDASTFGSKMPRADWDFIGNMSVPLPKCRKQRAIADYLDRETARLDAMVAEKERVLGLLTEKRRALITQAVTRGLNPSTPRRDSGIPWLGEIPSHWKLVPLKHGFGTIGSGTTPATGEAAYYDGDIPWVTTSELRENVIKTTNQRITKRAIDELTALRIYPVGSVLFAMYGATIGRVGLLGIEATVNQAVCVLAHSSLLDPRFTFYMLQASRDDFVSSASGGGQPNLNAARLREHRVACPALSEQRSIVKRVEIELIKIQSLRTATKRTITILKQRRAAIIAAAVTGQIDLENMP